MKLNIRNIYSSNLVWNIYKKSILKELCIPCYHVVNNKPPKHIKNLYPTVNIEKFESDLDFIGNKYDYITPSELFSCLAENKLPENKCILTFDDGYRECYDVIYPILKRKGIPAIFFIISDFVDNNKLSHFNKISLIIEELKYDHKNKIAKRFIGDMHLDRGDLIKEIRKFGLGSIKLIDQLGYQLGLNFDLYLNNYQPYLNKTQIKEMHSNGFGIGAHTSNHQRFTELNRNQQKQQIKWSLDFVESITNKPTHFFAFPYSSFGFKTDLYNDFPNLIFFDTYKSFKKSNPMILQRFIMDTYVPIKFGLLETRLKKVSYLIRFKKILI